MELKVIAIVKPFLYYLLWHFPFDRELMEAFKVSAIFDNKVDGIPENLSAFASWMDEYAKNKEFFTLDPAAKAKILEHLFRLGESQRRFACNVETIKSLIKESYFYALQDGSKRIKEQHVKKALAEKIFRSNIIEEKIQEEIAAGRIKVELKGTAIGQINGLAVYTLDHYSFGIPTRITVNTYRGKDGVMSLHQQVALADKTLDLGVKKLEGFFRQRYGREQTASLKATIAFEDYYESIGGPSASAAQLCALLSSLAEKPIRQDLAITGTVDQKGVIGVIGGVNEKIEGFYKSCKITGLTGTQGIIIPEKNQENLMLDEEVVEAVAQGKFHVYVADTIETAVELLMDCKMSEIDSLVKKRLKSWDH
jgi:predicted ATP-dependent protease